MAKSAYRPHTFMQNPKSQFNNLHILLPTQESRIKLSESINIKRKSTRLDCALAVQKWQDDIKFVNTYKTEDLPEVAFDKIIFKYRNEI